MTGKTTHKETSVTITHDVLIDSCIADEIRKLNNDDDIFTLSSCCGHGIHVGYIIVAGSEIEKMIHLGYETTALKYLDNEVESDDDKVVLCSFKPKSECNCVDK